MHRATHAYAERRMAQIVKRTLGDGKTVHYDVRTRIGGPRCTRTFKRGRMRTLTRHHRGCSLRGVAVESRSGRQPWKSLSFAGSLAHPAKRSSTMARTGARQPLRGACNRCPGDQLGDASEHSSPGKRLVTAAQHREPSRRTYDVLRAAFAFAVANDWLARSPCRGIKLPQITGTRRHDLTPEQVTVRSPKPLERTTPPRST